MLTDVLNERTLPYLATIAALGAWWVSWREARRNNRAILKLTEFSSCYRRRLGAPDAYELEVWVVNRGIQLQNISMALVFYGRGKSGTMSLPIPLSDQTNSPGSTFVRGTTARFALSTVDKDACQFLGALRSFKEQRPVINVYSSSFLACSFPIYSRWDGFRKLWNRLSFRLSFKRRVGDGHDGKGVFKTYQLPYFVIRSEKVRFFLDGVKKDPADNITAGAVGEHR
jgi:hypothetical protein